jgi:hypothetical protein
MIRIIATIFRSNIKNHNILFPKISNVRYLSDRLTIPTDKEQQAGRRKEELDAEEAGEVGFNDSAIIPEPTAGTKANPILVNIVSFFFN